MDAQTRERVSPSSSSKLNGWTKFRLDRLLTSDINKMVGVASQEGMLDTLLAFSSELAAACKSVAEGPIAGQKRPAAAPAAPAAAPLRFG